MIKSAVVRNIAIIRRGRVGCTAETWLVSSYTISTAIKGTVVTPSWTSPFAARKLDLHWDLQHAHFARYISSTHCTSCWSTWMMVHVPYDKRDLLRVGQAKAPGLQSQAVLGALRAIIKMFHYWHWYESYNCNFPLQILLSEIIVYSQERVNAEFQAEYHPPPTVHACTISPGFSFSSIDTYSVAQDGKR